MCHVCILYTRHISLTQATHFIILNLAVAELAVNLLQQETHYRFIQDSCGYLSEPTGGLGLGDWGYVLKSKNLKNGKNWPED